MPELVDCHCHLDLFPDPEAAVADCVQNDLYVITMTTTPRAWPRNRDIAARTRWVRPALGLHPQLVADRAHEIGLWKSYLHEARFVGEVGLDAGPRFAKSLREQQRTFEQILGACATAGGRVLSVHSVRTAPLVLDMIQTLLPSGRGTVILHWFSGSRRDAARAVELGCYFSVNSAMMATDRQRRIVIDLPANRLLTETDSPFVVHQGNASRPRDVSRTIDEVATARGESRLSLVRTIQDNLRRITGDRIGDTPPQG